MARRWSRLWSHRWLRFVLFFSALVWPWDWMGQVYAFDVSNLADAFLAPGDPSPIRAGFTLATCQAGATGGGANYGPWDLPVCLKDTTSGQVVQTALELRRSGYVALAVFVALTLATRLSATHKLRMFAIGIPALHVLPLLPLLSFFSGKLPITVFHFGSATRWFIETTYHTLVAPPGMAFAVPLLLWLVLAWSSDPESIRVSFPIWRARSADPAPPLAGRFEAASRLENPEPPSNRKTVSTLPS